MLHGYGAGADDLVPLADALSSLIGVERERERERNDLDGAERERERVSPPSVAAALVLGKKDTGARTSPTQ